MRWMLLCVISLTACSSSDPVSEGVDTDASSQDVASDLGLDSAIADSESDSAAPVDSMVADTASDSSSPIDSGSTDTGSKADSATDSVALDMGVDSSCTPPKTKDQACNPPSPALKHCGLVSDGCGGTYDCTISVCPSGTKCGKPGGTGEGECICYAVSRDCSSTGKSNPIACDGTDTPNFTGCVEVFPPSVSGGRTWCC